MSGRTGRPSDYQPAYVNGARMLARLGATDEEIAEFFDVSVRTLYRWRNSHDDFRQALKAGKEEADERVERSLYQRAIGYEQDAVKIFMPAGAEKPVYAPYRERIAPDTTAAIFWLKNRRPQEWRDKRDVDHTSSDGSMSPKALDLSKLSTEALAEIMRAADAPATD